MKIIRVIPLILLSFTNLYCLYDLFYNDKGVKIVLPQVELFSTLLFWAFLIMYDGGLVKGSKSYFLRIPPLSRVAA